MIGVGATLGERFTLVEELGQGGMGTVYRATDGVLGRSVAIKLLKDAGGPEGAGKIHLEAQILARLVHDRIVRLYDFGQSDGTCFLVMEEVDGPSFAGRRRDLPLADRLRICGQVAEALDYAHIQGVIHRDVKPGNVLLTRNDEAKLSDFGISLVNGGRGDQTGSIRGTPLYMSPEQAQGKTLDHRTDLYSVGVMLYECATGELPYGGHAMSLFGQHVNATPPAPRHKNPQIWSTLENLILSLLEKHPARRPASANLVALAIFEEVERARRLDRINPGHRRSDAPGPAGPPPSTTLTVGHRRAGQASANGRGPVVMSAIEPPLSGRLWSSASGTFPPPPEDPVGLAGSGRTDARGPHDHPLVRAMLAKVLETPIVLSPDQRYLCGHYLAYLLGGSRRRGVFLRRPLDAMNADRARLLLAMTWLSSLEPTDEEVGLAATLLDERPDVRAALNPVVVMKYLAIRDTVGKRRRFREIRRRLRDASAYARKAMLDARGALNPGLMPRTLDDLALIAPPRNALSGDRVSLWNRIAEVWRDQADFRRAVLRYATRSDQLDGVSADLWPEVVYPLIEHAHWQRTYRPRLEAIWDYVVGKLLNVAVPGVRLDRMMVVVLPLEVAEQLDEDLSSFMEDPRLAEAVEDDASSTEIPTTTEQRRPFWAGGIIPREKLPDDADDVPYVKPMVPLSPPDPFLIDEKSLYDLWERAMELQEQAGRPVVLHRSVPVGPYELAVIPTGRGRTAIRAVLQGMRVGKQIEMFTPLAHDKHAASRPFIAVWTYQDASMAVAYLDFQNRERYILWDAPDAHQYSYGSVEEMRTGLATMKLEVPDRLDRALAGK